MNRLSDQTYLLNDQYKDASNFNARLQIHERFSVNKYGWLSWVFDHFHVSLESRVLELGCGPGVIWAKNLSRIPEGWDITLTDFSPGMLEEAKRNLADGGRRFRFEVVDAQAIPFEAEGFDAVIANHMLYHIPDREKVFSEIRRVLKPGGRFYASTVGKAHLREMDGLVKEFNPRWVSWQTEESFLLENGADQMAHWFPGVVLHRYEDALVVTEAEPLIAYILTSCTKSALVEGRVAEFRTFVEQELARQGAIRITKAAGLFEAYRDGRSTGAEMDLRATHRKPGEPS